MVPNQQYVDIEIDKLTNSIENIRTRDSFPTDILIVENSDLKGITKKAGWSFNWKAEFKQPDRDVYKLTIVNNLSVIQGLVSLTERDDHVYMHLIESTPFNKGKDKVYSGVPGNLVAFAAKLSFHRGFEGYISFLAKTTLVDRYVKTLGASHVGGNLMVINTTASLKLIDKYFKSK
ncbi:MAG: hypothetical protein AAF944_26700 [Bacteroidota bacterium]